MMNDGRILVTGAAGNVGGELLRHLLGAHCPVRALVRADKAGIPPGVETTPGDLNEPDSLGNALRGVSRIFLLGGNRDMTGLLARIRDAGVEHVVLLSSRSVIGGNKSNAIVKMWITSEAALRSSGVSWTILRPSGFMSNALRWLPQLRAGDVVRAPFANVPIAAIDPFDVARVAALTLTTSGHAGREYVLTGPEALLPADQVRILARVLGRNLRFEPLPDDEARAHLAKLFSGDFVDAMFRFYAAGEFDDSSVLPTVFDLTGHAPRDFSEWARAHTDAFRFSAAGTDG